MVTFVLSKGKEGIWLGCLLRGSSTDEFRFELRHVIAERGFEDVVVALRSAIRIRGSTRAGPEVALYVAVLHPHAKPSLGPRIEVIPVPGGELLNILVVSTAIAWGGRSE